jgi:tape measure domain-containing protein
MATPIDDKVVAMSFDNKNFESGVGTTLSSLDKLKAALKFDGAGKGLQDLNASAGKVDLGHIGRGVEEIGSKLGALNVAAVAVFANIAMSAFQAGESLVKSLTISPIKQGFQEYVTNLNSIQTILSNTAAAGSNLNDVNKALDELNHYSDMTIYNFSQMAKNIGTFTAAGVDLDTSVNAIKGIANLAALSGSNADQASRAMYQLSQAVSSGTVRYIDWISVNNAGMGGAVFQRQLAQTAVAMGVLNDKQLVLKGSMKNVTIAGNSFKDSLSDPATKGWLSSKVLTNTLAQFTGDLKDADLAAQGFSKNQIKAIQKTAKMAMLAATQVKDIKTVFNVAQETAGSGWAETSKIIFGNFNEAKTTFTSLSNTINGYINASANARNEVLGDWKAMGGRTALIDNIKIAFKNLGLILKPIKEAFRDIFPKQTSIDLLEMTNRFGDFANALKPGKETVANLKRTFAGLFALLDIGKQIIGGIFTVFGQLFGSAREGSSGFLNFTGNIGDFIVSIDKALKKGDKLHNFFVSIGVLLSKPIELLGALGHALSDLFKGFSPGGFSGQIGGITKGLNPFHKILKQVSKVWDALLAGISGSGSAIKPAFDALISGITNLGPGLGKALSGMNFDLILQGIRTGLFAGLLVMIKGFLGTGGSFSKMFHGGVISNISGAFNNLSGSLGAMQNKLRAQALKELAIAIALLVLSVVALSFVKPDKLKAAIVAMGFMFAELVGAMKVLDKMSKGSGYRKLPFIVASLLILAAAIDLLVIAVYALSKLSWQELLKGLGSVGFLLAAISIAVKPLSANSGGMVRAGIGITGIAIALNILALAVKQFGNMSWTELGKGLYGVATGLGVIVLAMNKMPTKDIVKTSLGITIIAGALLLLAKVVKTFGAMDFLTMGKGMAAIGTALGVIAIAMKFMPKGGQMVLIALGLWGVAAALLGISKAIKLMGGMSAIDLAKGLIGLSVALDLLAGSLKLMQGNMAGAATLAIAAAGLALLVPAIVMLGKQSWQTLLTGLVALAAALAILGLAGKFLMPAIPGFLSFGAAMLLIGAGIALTGLGIAAVAAGLAALAVSGPAGIGILIAALEELIAAIPRMAKNFVLGILAIVDQLAATAPKFVVAIVKIISVLLDAIIKSTPKIVQAFNVLLVAALKILTDNTPKIVAAGMSIILSLLKGIRDNIGKIVTVVGDIIVKFINALSSELSKIITAGTNLVVKFIEGIGKAEGRVITAGVNVIIALIRGIGGNAVRLANAAGQAILDFLTGLTAAVTKYAGPIRTQSIKLGIAIIDGIFGGLTSTAHRIYDKAGEIMHKALSIFHKIPGVSSPSKVTTELGKNIILGFVNGLDANASNVYASAISMSNGLIQAFKDTFQISSPSKVMDGIGKAVGQGFAQGLRGSKDDINNAFIDLNNKVVEGMATTRETITSELAKLEQLRKDQSEKEDALKKLESAKKPDVSAIKKAKADLVEYANAIKEVQTTISENQNVLTRLAAGHELLTKTFKSQKIELLALTKEYDAITEKLKAVKDMIASYTSQYSAAPGFSDTLVPEIKSAREAIAAEQQKMNALWNDPAKVPTTDEITTQQAAIDAAKASLATLVEGKVLDASGNSVDQLATYMQALTNQTAAVGTYAATLEQLRKLGLDDATYQKLLTEGTADQSFATQLLSGGKTAVGGLNILDGQLVKVSKKLGTNAAKNLLLAGKDAAGGIVEGLESKRTEINSKMGQIAREMVAEFRKETKSHSPSQVFAEIGGFLMVGLAQGISNSSKIVTDAVDIAAQNALAAMRNSMSNLSNLITDELNLNPVITPILDLTQVQKDAQNLVVPITAAASFGQASTISSEQIAAQTASEVAPVPATTSIKFEQTNNSPVALTEIEIYRQTRNQISQLKSVLAHT